MTENNLLSSDPSEPKNYLDALTGPGGKFDKTKYSSEAEMYEAIAKGKWHADNALTVKERAFDDLAEDATKMREIMNSQASLQELIDQLKTPTMSNTHTPTGTEVQQPQVDLKQIESLIDTRYQVNKQADLEQSNLNQAKAKLTQRYGTNYSVEINKQLEDLGMTENEFNQMARTNPRLFERTFIPAQTSEDFQAPPRGTHRIAEPQQKRSWTFYQQMKKDNPRGYSDPKTQLQMMKDYESLGTEFEDGDFHKYN